jgi:hypothetical protein
MQAVEFWEEARPLFEKSSQQQDVLEIDTRLASVNREILDVPAKTVAKLRHLAVPVTRLQGRSNKIEQI